MTENLITINKVSDNCNMIVVNNTRIVINIGDITDADLQTILTADAILISNHDYKNYNKLMKLQEYEKQIICTIPTATLARIYLLESHCNRFEDAGTELVDDIDRIIDKFTTLKYSQPYELTENLIITAYRGGLTAGNTIWKISKNDESILVFNDINHRKENIVDGLDTEILKDVTVCMLQSNDKFVKLPPKEIEQNILKTIKAHKNTIIFTKYTRLLELCNILNRNKIYATVYSSKGQDYLESMRGMVEWAGENVLKEFSDVKQVPFNYENIAFSDDLDRLTNVTVLVDDYNTNYHAFVLLDKFKDIEDTCLLFLHDEELYNFVKERKFTLKVPKLVPFTENELEVMKKEQDDKMKLEEEDRILNEFLLTKEEESDDGIYLHDKETAKKMFWYEYKTDLWIHEGEEKFATFPEPRCLRYDDYGEIFNFKYNPEIKQDVAIAPDLCTKYDLPVNKIEWADVEFNLQHEIVYFDFDGLCDFNSVKNVLEIAKPKKLVVFGGVETTELFYNFFTFNPNFSDVFLLIDEVNLNVNQVNYEILKVADDFYDKLNFKKQGSYVISGFRGKIENSELVYIDTCDNYMVCDHKIYDLKRIFVDKGFKVDLSGDVLTIEDEVVLEIVDDEISITGDLNDCYQSVRKLLYESMIMI